MLPLASRTPRSRQPKKTPIHSAEFSPHSTTRSPGTTRSSTTTASPGGASTAFTQGYLKFEHATNELATAVTPLEDGITASSGNTKLMSKAFVTLGTTETSLADIWHPALVAFQALKPPPSLAKTFAATTADATRLYAGLRKISTIAHATSGTLTPRQFLAGSKDLQAFSTRARALAADFQTFDHRLGVS